MKDGQAHSISNFVRNFLFSIFIKDSFLAFSGDRLICLLVVGGSLPKHGRVENGSLLSYVVLVDGTQR
jgi:hypothetical protein